MSVFSTVCCFVTLMLALSDLHLPAEGCVCIPQELADIYCGADYAVKARVRMVHTIVDEHGNEEFRYKINIYRRGIFKLPDLNATTTKYLWATTGFATCPGVELTLRKTYYLVGNLDNQGRLYADTCTTSTPWGRLGDLSRADRRKLRRQEIVCPAIRNDV